MKKPSPIQYRRNLPHIQPWGAMFFITFRLYGSIPLAVLDRFSLQYEQAKIANTKDKLPRAVARALQENYFLEWDHYLDSAFHGPLHLANPNIAALVADALKYRDGKVYKLVCFCIMSNHVHMIIYKLRKPLDSILQSLKSFTGREALKLIEASAGSEAAVAAGAASSNPASSGKTKVRFWQAESFDRLIRDRNDMAAKISYTINNPVKAGLVSHWQAWQWSYCRPEFIE